MCTIQFSSVLALRWKVDVNGFTLCIHFCAVFCRKIFPRTIVFMKVWLQFNTKQHIRWCCFFFLFLFVFLTKSSHSIALLCYKKKFQCGMDIIKFVISIGRKLFWIQTNFINQFRRRKFIQSKHNTFLSEVGSFSIFINKNSKTGITIKHCPKLWVNFSPKV